MAPPPRATRAARRHRLVDRRRAWRVDWPGLPLAQWLAEVGALAETDPEAAVAAIQVVFSVVKGTRNALAEAPARIDTWLDGSVPAVAALLPQLAADEDLHEDLLRARLYREQPALQASRIRSAGKHLEDLRLREVRALDAAVAALSRLNAELGGGSLRVGLEPWCDPAALDDFRAAYAPWVQPR